MLIRQFRAAEQHATATMARWVGDAAVRGIIGRHKDVAEIAVLRVGRHLDCQKEVAKFCWYVFGFAGIGPDWELRRDAPWMLSPVEVKAMPFAIALFRHVVKVTIGELESAGVAVKPTWSGDHAAVGELLLLHVDWDLPAAELAAEMNSPGPGAITADASGTIFRRETGEREETNLAAIRRKFERHLNGPRQRAPYAGGGKRDGRSTTAKRREALADVLEKFPGATPSGIFTTFGNYTRLAGGQAGSPGGYLRQLLEAAAEPGETVSRPVKETLRQDLLALRAEKGKKQPS